MIKEVTIRNVVTGEEAEISMFSSRFVLDYVDWDTPSVSQSTYRVPKQIGKSLSGVTINTRKPTIYGYVVADLSNTNVLGMTMAEYYEVQERRIEEQKQELNRIISVFQDIQIEADGYFLDARPTSPVTFSEKEEENNEILCAFSIDLECYNPMFYQDSKIVSMQSVEDKFHFPLVIPESGLIFGEVIRRQSINIENAGDAEVGCTITITASGGSVVDPIFYNVNTGEYIGFDGLTLQDGEYIIITTDVSEENVIKHGNARTESVVSYLSSGSKFLKIAQGGDMYSYDVDEEHQNSIDVVVSYREQWFNIPGI